MRPADFPMNAWYVAAASTDLSDRPLGRQICGLPMVFFRDASGNVAALEDWCPHRGAPLSLGRVVEGRLVCGYHGLQMGCDGKTVAMPGQRVRGFPPVAAYPVVERHGFVWVWPGDAAQADAARLPALPWASDPAWVYAGDMFRVGCGYRLMVDNLMDLTHETYVHADSIGQPEIEDVAPVTRVEGDSVITQRLMQGISAPPFWRQALRGSGVADEVPVDRWQVCHFTPPSHVMIEVGVAHAGLGGPQAPADRRAAGLVVDFITPETDTSIWYFWGMARSFGIHDAALTHSIREGQRRIFSEDLQLLEQQQRNHLRHPGRALLGLNTDAGGVQARRIIDRLIEAESVRPAP